MVNIQAEDFDMAEQYALLAASNQAGAVVTFTGLVRDYNLGKPVQGLFLEHYPIMTERQLEVIIEQAKRRWPIIDAHIIHRIGRLSLNQQIVFVGVNSTHREAAFSACQYIMDYLKTQAPFWKKELSDDGEAWLDAQEKDLEARKKWK